MGNNDVKKEYVSLVEGDEHDEISSSVRTKRPGNFLFKIESFSWLRKVLTKTKCDKCDSCHFEAGGYKWKLLVYPNGDKKRGGDGYISLYLALADPKSLPQGDEVHVFFKFFVFDALRDTYLVLQDGKDKRFHAMKTEWGFANLLSLEIFNDPSQGYLVDDCSVFGVEMFVHKKDNNAASSLSIKNNLGPHESTFTWKIDKFSTLPEFHRAEVFNVGGIKWTLHLYQKDDSGVKDKTISLFLVVHDDHASLPSGWNIYAECKLTILDQLNKKHVEIIDDNGDWFSANTGWGYSDLIKLSELKRESRGFVVEDTVVVEVKFLLIYATNSLTISTGTCDSVCAVQ